VKNKSGNPLFSRNVSLISVKKERSKSDAVPSQS
jgi:hypothetical protein